MNIFTEIEDVVKCNDSAYGRCAHRDFMPFQRISVKTYPIRNENKQND